MKDILKLLGLTVIYAATILGGFIIGSFLGMCAIKIASFMAGML